MAKRLVVCCDGTWNTPDQKIGTVARPTNVTKLALSISSSDAEGTRQCAYYHPGVGTSRWDHIRGGAFGTGLSANVLDAYQFLIDNYEDGDELWFFGFSRGAYTARSVAGLVRNCGILRHAESRPDAGGLRALSEPGREPSRYGVDVVPARLLLRAPDPVHRGVGHGRRARHPGAHDARAPLGRGRVQPPTRLP